MHFLLFLDSPPFPTYLHIKNNLVQSQLEYEENNPYVAIHQKVITIYCGYTGEMLKSRTNIVYRLFWKT